MALADNFFTNVAGRGLLPRARKWALCLTLGSELSEEIVHTDKASDFIGKGLPRRRAVG